MAPTEPHTRSPHVPDPVQQLDGRHTHIQVRQDVYVELYMQVCDSFCVGIGAQVFRVGPVNQQQIPGLKREASVEVLKTAVCFLSSRAQVSNSTHFM